MTTHIPEDIARQIAWNDKQTLKQQRHAWSHEECCWCGQEFGIPNYG